MSTLREQIRETLATQMMLYQNDHETLEWPAEKVQQQLAAIKEPHSGDCTKQPWTCMRCVAEEVYNFADKALLAILALRSQSEGSSQEQLRAKDEEIARLRSAWTAEAAQLAGECHAEGVKAETAEAQLAAANLQMEGLKGALAGAGSKIEVALSCLGEKRFNPAGYLTDAALWLDRAGSQIQEALQTASVDESAASLHGDAPEAAPPGWSGAQRISIDDGELDEVVVYGGAHLERMSAGNVFLNLGRHDGSSFAVWLTAKRSKLSMTWEERDSPAKTSLSGRDHEERRKAGLEDPNPPLLAKAPE